jgi:hypothetical protein
MTQGYRSWFQTLINICTVPATVLKNKVMYWQFIDSVAFVNYKCCTSCIFTVRTRLVPGDWPSELTGRTEFVCWKALLLRTCIWTRVGWCHLSLTGRDEWQHIMDRGLAVAFRKAGAKSVC